MVLNEIAFCFVHFCKRSIMPIPHSNRECFLIKSLNVSVIAAKSWINIMNWLIDPINGRTLLFFQAVSLLQWPQLFARLAHFPYKRA